MRILACDQARTTGYAVFDNGTLVDYGALELGSKSELYENMLHGAKERVRQLVTDKRPDLVVVEDIQQQQQYVATFKKLAMLLGVLLSLFQEMGLRYAVVSSGKWRALCGIKGRSRSEQKKNTLRFVQDTYGLEDITEDMADSIAMGHWAVHSGA